VRSVCQNVNSISDHFRYAWNFLLVTLTVVCGLAAAENGLAAAEDSERSRPAELASRAAELELTKLKLRELGNYAKIRLPEILNAELGLLDQCCHLTVAQKSRLRIERNRILARIGQDVSDPQFAYEFHNALQDIVQARIVESALEILTPDQIELYRAEASKRRTFQSQAIARLVVARLDEKISLTPKQRDQILETLVTRFDVRRRWYLGGMVENEIPLPPEDLVAKFLTESQKTKWPTQIKSTSNDTARLPLPLPTFKGDPLATE